MSFSPSRIISVAIPANLMLRFTPSPFSGFEDGFVAMDPEDLSYA